MINNYLNNYLAHMILGEFEQANLSAYEIFKKLIENGMLLDELMDENYVTATLKHDYNGYILDECVLESLVELLGIYADQDGIKIDEEEVPIGEYLMVRYGLNLLEGTKNRIQANHVFNGIYEVAEFLGIHLATVVEELEVDGGALRVGVTALGARENILETLNQQTEVELETIADNVPETADLIMVFTYRDILSDKIVYADIYALYGLGEFSLED